MSSIGVSLGSRRWGLYHWDGDDPWTAIPRLRAEYPTRKAGLKERCRDGHNTRCCTVQPLGSVG